jgi:serine/threonine protein kinase/hemoglobin-like flavoprotein/class 3 adenylate cyclase
MVPIARLGKYNLVDQIGRGAMGEVFRAHDPDLDRYVALKVIAAGDADTRMRFRREAQSAARLVHPNIVVVHDFGEESGRFFMAMELLDGNDLKRLIQSGAFPSLGARLHVMEQICDAMAFAHSTNIVHRDLKPANIFVLPNGQVKILDFGVARIGGSDMTGTGMILGTPNYMAPEQIRGHRVDARADIFSLGTVFHELLCGRRAFEADSIPAILYAVIHHEPKSLTMLDPSIPPVVAELVTKTMQKDASRRFRSVEEIRNIIRILRVRGTLPPSLTLGELMKDATDRTVIGSGDILLTPSVSFAAPRSMAPMPIVPPAVSIGPPSATFAGEPGGEINIAISPGQTLLDAALEAGIPHTHECGGNARCSTCRVIVIGGRENLSARDTAELKLAQRFGFGDEIRLACQTKVTGPVRVRRLIIDSADIRIMRSAPKAVQGSEMPLALVSVRARELASLMRRWLPQDLIHILNRFYYQIGETVLTNGGILEPPAGGNLLAFFGSNGEDAKTKCTNAIRAAIRMRERMAPLNEYLTEHFGVSLTVDIGLHYGRMIVGSVGHPDHMRTTALGDAAGIAEKVAELSSMNPIGGILATEEMLNVVDDAVTSGAALHERIGEREFTVYEIEDFAKPDTHYIVQLSFEKIAAQRSEAARIFYEHLFAIAPRAREMFAHVDMAVQGEMLMNMIAAAVKGLDRLDELKPVLVDLGKRHARYHVSIDQYAAVEACLLHTIATIMGPDFNLDVKLAWTRIYNFIAETMIEAQLSERGA